MNWRWIGLTAVAAAALISYGVLTTPDHETDTTTTRAAPMGYYLKDATITDTGASGNAQVAIAARVIEQNPSDNSVQLKEVRVDYLAQEGKPWTLTADSGFMPAVCTDDAKCTTSKTLTFYGNVALRGQAWDSGAVVHTKSLSLQTDKQIATTRDDVTIEIGRHIINSKGLQADLKTEKLKLESSHGRYLPQ